MAGDPHPGRTVLQPVGICAGTLFLFVTPSINPPRHAATQILATAPPAHFNRKKAIPDTRTGPSVHAEVQCRLRLTDPVGGEAGALLEIILAATRISDTVPPDHFSLGYEQEKW